MKARLQSNSDATAASGNCPGLVAPLFDTCAERVVFSFSTFFDTVQYNNPPRSGGKYNLWRPHKRPPIHNTQCSEVALGAHQTQGPFSCRWRHPRQHPDRHPRRFPLAAALTAQATAAQGRGTTRRRPCSTLPTWKNALRQRSRRTSPPPAESPRGCAPNRSCCPRWRG
jgi:hypothetical protein